MCDRKDDNCDGVIDEMLLRIGPALPLSAYDGELWSVELAGAPAASSAAGGYLVAFITRGANQTTRKLTALRVSAEGRLLGTPIVISEDAGTTMDVAWNGTAW